MVVGAWATLFTGGADGSPPLLTKPVPSAKIDDIEKKLRTAIQVRSDGRSETRALEQVFKQFDKNHTGDIDFPEFRAAMERFGLATGGHEAVSGCTLEVIKALFDRCACAQHAMSDCALITDLRCDVFDPHLYFLDSGPADDPDGSSAITYDEFIKGLFKLPTAPASTRKSTAAPTAATSTSLPLPSERGESSRPPSASGSYARGRGGAAIHRM